jgi:peptidoglycan/xylan/chitin deacetylase (PgdA/CDA1 family)
VGRRALALAALLLLAAAAPVGAAGGSDPKGDATGPLDLLSADLTPQGTNLQLTVTTAGTWSSSDLVAGGARSLCLRLTAGVGQVCVQGLNGRTVLIAPGSTQPITAAVHRANQRSLQARFSPDQVGLKPGDSFRWQVASSWDGSTDVAPDSGPAAATAPQPQVMGCTAAGASFRTNGPRNQKVVALTFDDGPFPLTPRFYDVLEREHVPATFFLIGEQVPGKGALLKRALRDGFVLGDHTWTHANVSGDGPAAASQITRTRNAIRAATGGYTPCLFRAPGGAVSGALISEARRLEMNTIQWDVDPTDWSTPGTDVIYSRVISQARPGSIILMHDGGGPRGQTLAALPRIIATLRSRGYKFATVPDLLGLQPVYG